MNPMTQSDFHPDADALNAFVEHTLSDTERTRVVAHMAGCERCREIVYLAQAAAEPEMVPAAVVKAEPRPGWFSAAFAKWRVALVPAAAFASVGAMVLWVQLHPGPARMEMAKSSPQNAPRAAEVANAGLDQAAQPSVPPSRGLDKSAAARAVTRPAQAERIPRQERQKAAAPPAGIVAMDQLAAAPAIAAGQDRDTSAIHLDGRSASMARYAAGQGGVTSAAAPSPAVAPAPVPPNILATHGELAPAAPGGPSLLAVQSQPNQERAFEPSNGFALMRLARKAKLPSGLNTVSSAALLNRLVAVDSAGSVFLSQDGGKHWEAVKAQWSGKAVAVQAPPQPVHQLVLSAGKSQPTDVTAVSAPPARTGGEEENTNAVPAAPPPAGATAAAPAADNPIAISGTFPAVPGLLFKLLTDRHETWISADGKYWREK